VENIQRKDLTPFEEAEALQHLAQRSSYTHEALARKLGKSRTSITESLALNAIPEDIKNLCRLADISSKSLLLQVVRQPTLRK
jgi:ParB family chromosome partitioning protein